MPPAKTETKGTITVRNKEIPTVTKIVPQSSLKFYADNPRIYSIVRADGKEPSQEEIYDRLKNQDHVKQLIQDIRVNGGLIEPLIVRNGSMEVLEGNSRLAAYRFLAEKDPLKWVHVKCTFLPRDVDHSLVFAILGQYHIKGKKDWVPFEQAGFLYRRFKVDKIDVTTLAKELGLSQQKVKHLIDTYQFMIDHNQHDTNRWSYFDEYLKSKKIKKARDTHPDFDKLIVKKINSGEIPRAVDVRDDLPLICSGPTRCLNRFVAGKTKFTDAVEEAKDGGSGNSELKKLEKFRSWIVTSEVGSALDQINGPAKARIVFELNKISTRIQALQKKLAKK